jgi:NADH-quinone oxidoreductase subunit J
MLTFVFYLFAFLCVGSALFVAFTPNVVHAAFALALTFGSMAGLFVLLGADFLAATQLLIYVGAILVLMLFGIMYTHNIARISGQEVMMQVGPGLLVALLTLFTLVATVLGTDWPTQAVEAPESKIEPIGVLIMTDYLLPLEVAGILLLVALVGAAVITQPSLEAEEEETSS